MMTPTTKAIARRQIDGAHVEEGSAGNGQHDPRDLRNRTTQGEYDCCADSR